ncbi:MAG: DNA polymerase, partial [Candidatus Anstonellales archaeon]
KTFGLGEKVTITDFATVDEETLIRRALTDVEIEGKLVVGMLDVFEQLGINLKLTLSKTSYSYLTENVEFNFGDVLSEEGFLRGSVLSYRGGRTEMFYKGVQKNVFIYDVNSLYPYVMYEYTYPIRFKFKTKDMRVIHDQIKNGNCVLAKVRFYNDANIGVKYEDRLVFPKGEMIAWLNTREMEYLLGKGLISEVLEAYVFEGRKIFNRIKTLYDMRMKFKKEGKESLQYITKILMNSGYGRFGYRVEEMGFDKELALELEAAGYNVKEYEWGNYYFFRITNIYKYNQLTLIAAEVTANARMHITNYKNIVESGGGKVYYMDTDSLFTDKKGKEILYEHNLVGNELGLLKEEYTGVTVEFILPKVYTIFSEEGNVIKKKMKGVSKDALLLYTDEELMKFKDQSGTSILVNRGIVRGAVIWRNIEKQLKLNEYKKGRITESGWVVPLELSGYDVEQSDKVVFI